MAYKHINIRKNKIVAMMCATSHQWRKRILVNSQWSSKDGRVIIIRSPRESSGAWNLISSNQRASSMDAREMTDKGLI